jgi:plastocyanin
MTANTTETPMLSLPLRANKPQTKRSGALAAGLLSLCGLVLAADILAETAAGARLMIVDESGLPVDAAVVWTDVAVPATGNPGSDTRASAEIDQRDKRFVPYVSVVAPDTDVYFPNSDDIRHHVYSFSEGNSFERKLYRANEAEPVRFSKPGIVALGCNIHDNMQAYVVVGDEPALISDTAGTLLLPGGAEQIRVWHPLLGEEHIALSVADLPVDAGGYRVIKLPIAWKDPQAPRNTQQLESLLRQFSRDAR